MKSKKIKFITAVVLSTSILSTAFVSCSNSSNSAANDNSSSSTTDNTATSDSDSSDTNVDKIVSTTLLGQVQDVTDNIVTIGLVEESEDTTSTDSESDGTEASAPDASGDQGDTSTDAVATDGDSTEVASGENGEPPEMPTDGEAPSGEAPSGEAPSGDGEAPGEPPTGDGSGMMGGGSSITYSLTGEEKTFQIEDENIITVDKGDLSLSGNLDDIIIGEIINVEFDDDGNITKLEVQSNNTSYTGGSQTGSITLSGASTADGEDKTSENETVESTTSDQNVFLSLNEAVLNITRDTINKSGDTTSEEESNFYAVNSAVVAASQGTINISDSNINTSSEGSNGVFATGDGSVINISDTTINTTSNSSRGLDATYNGTIIADNVDITTVGAHCASVATDRGEGTIHVSNSTGNTAGEGSPGIYSTGRITAKNCDFTATGAQACVIEGKNSITLTDSTLVGYKTNGVMLYQSTSGDSGEGTCYFNMTGGSIKAMEGPMFYITNTDAVINLKNATLETESGVLLDAAIGRWGNEGSNGGSVTLNAKEQELIGNITCDDISSAIINLKESSSLDGTINAENTSGIVSLYLDETSSWTVEGDSYLEVITDDDDSFSNIKDNGHTIYYNSSNEENSWLDGKTVELSGGGTLTPLQ